MHPLEKDICTLIRSRFLEERLKKKGSIIFQGLFPRRECVCRARLAYEILSWKVHRAVIKAKLEPYLGFLHSIQYGKSSLVCDFWS